MKAEEQTKLNETLVKVFKLTEEQLSTLYNEDGDLSNLECVLQANEQRVAKFSTEKTAQYNRGIKEGAGKIEKEIKDKYAVESDLIGVDLLDHIVLSQVESAKESTTKDISKHPDYIKLESSIGKQLKDRDKDWEQKWEERERVFKRDKLFEKVRDRALSSLEGRNPILPADPKKAQAWRNTYLNDLRRGNYQETEDGTLIVLDADGNLMKDTHGNPVTFDEFEKAISDTYFEYPTSQPRTSPGNQPPKTGGNGEPRSKAEAWERLKDPKITPDDRKKYTELYESLNE